MFACCYDKTIQNATYAAIHEYTTAGHDRLDPALVCGGELVCTGSAQHVPLAISLSKDGIRIGKNSP